MSDNEAAHRLNDTPFNPSTLDPSTLPPLPPGLTFAGSPAVSTLVSNGLTVGNPALESCSPGCQRFAFDVTHPSTTGPGRILVSNIAVAVPAGFVPSGSPPVPVSVGITQQPSTGGLTPAPAVQFGTLIPPPTVPTLTGMSINAVAAGVTTTVTLTGFLLDQLNFGTGPGQDTLDFGPGITVLYQTITVTNGGTKLQVQIQVAPGAAVGLHNIVITDNPTGTQIELDGQLQVNPPPTVTSAGTGNGTTSLLSPLTGDVLKSQTVIINGTGFQPATTVPSNLVVAVSGTGITVNSVAYNSNTQIVVNADVAKNAQLVSPRTVTVTNPDLGVGVGVGKLAVALAPPDQPEGQAPAANQGISTPPTPPTIGSICPPLGACPPPPASAALGATVKISGTGFSTTAANNLVTFTGPNNIRVTAKVLTSPAPTATVLNVQVPATAVDGPVRVAVSGVPQSATATPVSFTVTNPTLSSVVTIDVAGQPSPASGKQGQPVTLDLFGSKFQPNPTPTTVAINPTANLTLGPVTFVDSTHLRVPVTIDAGATLGLRDVTVTNPVAISSTLAKIFEVKSSSPYDVEFALTRIQGGQPAGSVAIGDFLPSLEAVQLTLDGGTGRCTGRHITPTVYLLEATVGGGALPPNLTFTLTSPPPLPGTATNEDCEPNLALPTPLPAEADFSIGPVNQDPSVATQQATAINDGGVYRVWLASWDWGGSVRIDVTSADAPTLSASLTLPVDTDGDGLPDMYETDTLNVNKDGVNVLDRTVGGQGGTAKFAADGLTNFEKYRGAYLRLNTTSGVLDHHVRLGSGMRNLFVRGVGFSTDPTLGYPTYCGVDSSTRPPTRVSWDQAVPCPKFLLGEAFVEVGVRITDVTEFFSDVTAFPTKLFADPTKRGLDLATVTYDTRNCSGGASCDHTSKLAPRQWNFPTLGFSTFGSASTYGTALVLGRAFKAYFLDKPYLHQENFAGAFLPTSTTGGIAMLAPPTVVCDKDSKGADDGRVQGTESTCAVGGVPGGDVYQAGLFNLDMTAMDVNNDGCVELPFVADPTTLTACDPTADSVTAPPGTPQATFQQVARHIITHELGHAVGVNAHFTTDTHDLMYSSSINWVRDGHLSGALATPFTDAAKLIQIHNKGLP